MGCYSDSVRIFLFFHYKKNIPRFLVIKKKDIRRFRVYTFRKICNLVLGCVLYNQIYEVFHERAHYRTRNMFTGGFLEI